MFVTEDMTLVTVLKTKGIEPIKMERSNGGCRWLFDGPASDVIAQTLDEYNADECYVEPRDFTKKMGLVRKEMYRFLGHDPMPVRR